MSKPKWEDAPNGANFLSRDKDGEWFWHQDEPRPFQDQWISYGYMHPARCHVIEWEETLERRP